MPGLAKPGGDRPEDRSDLSNADVATLRAEVTHLRGQVDALPKDRPASRWYVNALLCVGALAMLVMFTMLRDETQRVERLVESEELEEVDEKITNCEEVGEFRRTFRRILAQVANPPEGTSSVIDFSVVDGFDRLEPDLQFFLGNLAVVLAAGAGDGNSAIELIRDEYIKEFPIVDCEALRVELEREAEADE